MKVQLNYEIKICALKWKADFLSLSSVMLLQSLYYFLPDSVDGTADLTQRKPQRVYVDSSWDKYPAFSPPLSSVQCYLSAQRGICIFCWRGRGLKLGKKWFSSPSGDSTYLSYPWKGTFIEFCRSGRAKTIIWLLIWTQHVSDNANQWDHTFPLDPNTISQFFSIYFSK